MELQLKFVRIPKNGGTSLAQAFHLAHLPIEVGHHGKSIIVVLRHPYLRFASAVRYTIHTYSYLEHIQAILDHGLSTPTDWAEVLAGQRGGPAQELVLPELGNVDTNTHD